MENYRFYMVPSAGSRIPVEFTVDESGKVDLSLRGTGTKGSEIERGRWAETILINFKCYFFRYLYWTKPDF